MKTGIYQDSDSISQNLLGKGSLGEVVKVEKNGQEYALKRIDKLKIQKYGRGSQLKRQLEILKKLNHPNIVKFESFNDQGPRFYEIRMQYCHGQDLRQFLQSQQYRKRILPTKKAKRFAVKVSLGIIYAYTELRSHMIINRDIKLDNIMVNVIQKGDSLQIISKMIDFGQSKFVIQTAKSKVGTNGYMSPQIYFGGQYTDSCDSWSLGLTIYEIFEGVKENKLNQKRLACPFKENFYPSSDKDYEQLYTKIAYQGCTCLSVSRTPKPFRQIIRGFLKYDPLKRLKTTKVAQILIQDIQQIKDCFESVQQWQQQKINLHLCLSKNKETDRKKQLIANHFSMIRNMHEKIFKPLNQLIIPIQQRKPYIQIIKLIYLTCKKISQQMAFVQQLMNITTQFAIKEVFSQIMNEQNFYELISWQKTYENYFTRQSIQIPNCYSELNMKKIEEFMKNQMEDMKLIIIIKELLEQLIQQQNERV